MNINVAREYFNQSLFPPMKPLERLTRLIRWLYQRFFQEIADNSEKQLRMKVEIIDNHATRFFRVAAPPSTLGDSGCFRSLRN